MKVANYYTDASINFGEPCSACIKHIKGNVYHYVKVVRVVENSTNIHQSEAIAIKLALIDIYNNYDESTIYNIYTDSDAVINLINNQILKYPEITEILRLLDMVKVNIYLVKSHTNPEYQQMYFLKHNNAVIGDKQAYAICKGNEKVDSIARSLTNVDNTKIYRSTPFDIAIPIDTCPFEFVY